MKETRKGIKYVLEIRHKTVEKNNVIRVKSRVYDLNQW